MHVLAPPGDPVVGSDRVRVSRIERRLFSGEAAAATDPELRVYLSDLVAPYGLPLREDLLDAGVGQSYADMAEALVRAVVAAEGPPDLIILAHAMPDVVPGRATASHLSHVCPGNPIAFAVCDQGVAAAFTAVSLARAHVAARPLVLMVEQSTLHYVPGPQAAPAPQRHAAVALLLGDPNGPRLAAPTHHTDTAAHRVAAVLAGELTALSADGSAVTAVLGADLAARMAGAGLPAAVRAAPAQQPFTGLWWELGEELADRSRGPRRVLLADYDPALRYLCAVECAVDVGLTHRSTG